MVVAVIHFAAIAETLIGRQQLDYQADHIFALFDGRGSFGVHQAWHRKNPVVRSLIKPVEVDQELQSLKSFLRCSSRARNLGGGGISLGSIVGADWSSTESCKLDGILSG